MTKGKSIVFEGFDGTGKTALCRDLRTRLISMGESVLYVREPGGVPKAPGLTGVIRQTIVGQGIVPDIKTSLFLYAAAMRENLVRNIIPAVDKGKWVICDRGFESMLAYQGAGDGLDKEFISGLRDFIFEGYRHHKVFYMATDLSLCMRRLAKKGENPPCRQKSERIIEAYEKMYEEAEEGYFYKLDARLRTRILTNIVLKELFGENFQSVEIGID